MRDPESAARLAWSVHLFTASGVVVGMLAIEAIFHGRARAAMLALLVTQIIDGIDGPMARSVLCSQVLPKIDGYVMDLVIDYVTCVVAPALFLHQFGLLPKSVSLVGAGAVVFCSAIWFSRTDMMTDDHWFRGFPAVWNLIAPSMLLTHSDPVLNAVLVALLCALMLTDVPFPHPVRVSAYRPYSLTVTILWLVGLAVGAARYPDVSELARGLVLVGVAYFAVLAMIRMRQQHSQSVSPAVR